MGTGKLTIRMLHDVRRIRLAPGGGYVVEADQIDIQGHVRQRHELVCTHLFIGAGSIASSEMMVRARDRSDTKPITRRESQSAEQVWPPRS